MFIKFAKVALPKKLKEYYNYNNITDAYLICFDDELKQGWLLVIKENDHFYEDFHIKERIEKLGRHKLSKIERDNLFLKIRDIKNKSGSSMTLWSHDLHGSKYERIKSVYEFNKSRLLMKDKINFLLKNF